MGNDTGGTQWVELDSEKANKNSESMTFKKLDDLVNSGEISEMIGYRHLDVEGMEDKAILGGLNSIMKYKPILSLEEHNIECRKLKDILEPLGYKYIKRLGANNIYEYTKEDYSPSRAQFGQDLWALEHHNHKRNGTYLEIGVHDGENANNTVMMDQEYGWSGVCVDPFMNHMESRSCQKFYVALGSEPGEADFRYGGDNENHSVFAGLDKFATTDDNKMHKDAVSNFKMKKVPVRTPEDVFTEANLPSTIDYMSLDVEGAEMDILKSFPFDKYCVKYATIETNNDKEKEKEMEEFMTQRGYKFEGHKEVDHIFSNTC